jgi:hypothetical protein
MGTTNNFTRRTDLLLSDDLITKRGTAAGCESLVAVSILQAFLQSLIDAAPIPDGSVTNAKVAVGAAIALSKLATDPLARANHTGSQLAATISDFAAAVIAAGIADGTVTNAKVAVGAAIALSKLAVDPLARANHTGTQLAATISDFTAAVLAVGGADGTSIRETITTGSPHGFSAKQAVFNNNGVWTLSRSDNISTARYDGIIESVPDSTHFVVVYIGKFATTGWTPGTRYYISDATAGLLVASPPSAAGSYVVPVARAATTTLAYIEPSDPLSLALIPNSALASDAARPAQASSGEVTAGSSSGALRSVSVDQIAAIATAFGGGGGGTAAGLAISATHATDNTAHGVSITGLLAGASIAQWAAVYVGSTGTLFVADADGSGTYPARGLAVAAYSSTDPAEILLQGTVRHDAWNWIPGGTLYLSATTGALTQTPPSVAGDKVQQVGFALTADIAYFDFSSGEYVTVA